MEVWDKEAKILIKVIEPREHIFRGLIKGFKESAIRNPKEISSYEDGIVFVHTGHPVVQHYIKIIKKDFGNKYVDSLAYRMFRTNLFVDRICKQIALEKDKKVGVVRLRLISSNRNRHGKLVAKLDKLSAQTFAPFHQDRNSNEQRDRCQDQQG